MNSPIRTNQVDFKVNISVFNDKYDVFRVRTDDKYFKNGAYIIDAPFLNDSVRSVLFERGNTFLVLMDRNEGNFDALKRTFDSQEEGRKITFSKEDASLLKESEVLQLLLNSMSSQKSEFLKCNNLTGHFYCFHNDWLRHDKKSEKNIIWQVPCLELRITQDMKLCMSMHTFTSELLRKKITFGARKFEEYPKYVFSRKSTLRRKLKEDDEPAFIMRQLDGKKTDIPFIDLQDIRKYRKSKVGMLASIVSNFNMEFAGLASIEFDTIKEYTAIDYSRRVQRENQKAIQEMLLAQSIKIVDQIGDEYSDRFCRDVAEKLLEKYGVKATVGKRVSKGALNICVIHNAAYYEDIEDPYKEKHEGVAIQHITFEDFSGKSEFAISTIVHELLIKKDILSGQITLFDWNALGYQEDFCFGCTKCDNGVNRYFFMNIKPDGSFTFTESKLDFFSMDQYHECVEIFENAKAKSEDVQGLLKNSDGKINIIKGTDWITLPELFAIDAELLEGNNKLRGRSKRDELLTSCLDIKCFEQGGDTYYFVGEIGEGMRNSISHSTNIRRIVKYKDAPDFFEQLLPLMSVSFVKNGQLTVIPFPYKYLREHIKTVK